MTSIILASQSEHRARILLNAGVSFITEAANIDERSVEKKILESGAGGNDVAECLSIAKATEVSVRRIDAYVIGCDQTLSFDGKLLHKPKDMEEARRRLLLFSGKIHELNSGVAIVRNGEILWSDVEICKMEFRDISPDFAGRHLAQAGDDVLSSVGAYKIEGAGVQLFKKIQGDFFSIMGLPLIPLLQKLREFDLLDG